MFLIFVSPTVSRKNRLSTRFGLTILSRGITRTSRPNLTQQNRADFLLSFVATGLCHFSLLYLNPWKAPKKGTEKVQKGSHPEPSDHFIVLIPNFCVWQRRFKLTSINRGVSHGKDPPFWTQVSFPKIHKKTCAHLVGWLRYLFLT